MAASVRFHSGNGYVEYSVTIYIAQDIIYKIIFWYDLYKKEVRTPEI